MEPRPIHLALGTAVAAAATGIAALIFALTCNESLNEAGLEGAVCGVADGVAVASVALGFVVPLIVGWRARRGQATPGAFSTAWLGFVGWAVLLVVAAAKVG